MVLSQSLGYLWPEAEYFYTPHSQMADTPRHESEALEGKQKLQKKTFSELAECLARIPLKITFYGRLFKYNDVGRLLLLMFSIDSVSYTHLTLPTNREV